MFELAMTNLLAPPVLFFALGLFAALVKSDLAMPDAAAKLLSLYLLLAIGFKGGVAASSAGLSIALIEAIILGIALSALMPLVVFPIFKRIAGLDGITAAATAAHYGSISIVTFVAATDFAMRAGIEFSGHMVAVAVAMESPAILTGLVLASLSVLNKSDTTKPVGEEPVVKASLPKAAHTAHLIREVFFNGSVILLVGAFAIGLITGQPGMKRLDPFVNQIFQGVLCLFLLEMGLVAGRRIFHGDGVKVGLVVASLLSTLLGAGAAFLGAKFIGASQGDTAILITLGASASYIAVPAAMRVALPNANPGAYLTASLGVTFPFNLTVGLPLYFWLASII
jgi:uncharacterized protein